MFIFEAPVQGRVTGTIEQGAEGGKLERRVDKGPRSE
jgi:hypothetical protein